jgi:hypothetical protein
MPQPNSSPLPLSISGPEPKLPIGLPLMSRSHSSRNGLAICHTFAWAFVIISTAVVLRVAGAWNDLWFDEIMSIELANQISRWWGVFDEFKYDNNHYLMTFWLYALGTGHSALAYRGPSILAGAFAIPVTFWAVKPYGKTPQCVAAILMAFSYVHIHYSSEARGYALQILFAVAAFGFLDRYHRTPAATNAIGFGVCSSLALLSHLLTINFLLACGFWAVSFQGKQTISRCQQWQRIAACLWLPLTTGAFLYAVNVHSLRFGGGPRLNTLLVTSSAWSLVVGVATPGTLRIATGVIALAISAFALWKLAAVKLADQGASESWKFFLVLLFIIPVARLFIPNGLLFARYFLLQIVFALILLSIVAGQMSIRPAGRRLVWVCVAMFVLLNVSESLHLASVGRGSYRQALQSMRDQSQNGLTAVAFSNRILNEPVVNYFLRTNNSDLQKAFCIRDPDQSPEWYIVHETMDCSADLSAAEEKIELNGQSYRLRFISNASYLSGFRWTGYQRQESPNMFVH